MPKKDENILKFKHLKNTFRQPFIIYADTESML